MHSGVPNNWWILVSCETKSLSLFSCTVLSPGLGKRLCCTEKCTDKEQERLWPWLACSWNAGEQVALDEERGDGRRSWRWDLSMETQSSSRAQSSAMPPTPGCAGSACAQSPCTEMHLLSACPEFQVVGRLSWSSEHISLIFPHSYFYSSKQGSRP